MQHHTKSLVLLLYYKIMVIEDDVHGQRLDVLK